MGNINMFHFMCGEGTFRKICLCGLLSCCGNLSAYAAASGSFAIQEQNNLPDSAAVIKRSSDKSLSSVNIKSVWKNMVMGIRSEAGIRAIVSSRDTLPFWATANMHGIMPKSGGAIMSLKTGSCIDEGSRRFQLGFGASGVTYFSGHGNNFLIDELYGAVKKGIFRLDIGRRNREYYYDGMYHNDLMYGGLSVSNGNIIYSGNARTMPGYNLIIEPFVMPFTNERVKVYANFSDYKMLDNRYVDGTMVHSQSLFINVRLAKRWSMDLGLEDWAQWAGKNPDGTKNPSGFKDYLRIITGTNGGSDASASDMINALGNHLGRILCKLNYRGDGYRASLAMDGPYDDGSGMSFQNFPDAIWTLYYGSDNKKRWVSDVVLEIIYTKSQSGMYHLRPVSEEEKKKQDPNSWHYGYRVSGGNDNYFNNSCYKSGWTYYGRIAGIPLYTPMNVGADGVTMGICNNRVLAYHFGIRGMIARKLPYSLKVTYSKNYGRYTQSYKLFDSIPHELYIGLDGELPHIKSFPFVLTYGVYSNEGEIFKDCVAFSFGMKLKF